MAIIFFATAKTVFRKKSDIKERRKFEGNS